MLRLLLGLLVVVVIGLLGHGYWSQLHPRETAYVTAKVVRADITEVVGVTGQAEPLQIRPVLPDIPQGALVEKVYVDYNDPVEADQGLADLSSDLQQIQVSMARVAKDSADLAAKAADSGVTSAQAALDVAKAKQGAEQKRLEGIKKLSEAVRPENQLEAAEQMIKAVDAGVNLAASELKRAKVGKEFAGTEKEKAKLSEKSADLQLRKTKLKSPIKGFVLNIDLKVGDIVGRPKMSLNPDGGAGGIEIASPLDRMRGIVKVSEADLGRVRVGQTAIFSVDAFPEEKFPAKVTQIRNSPSGDRTGVTYPTVLEFDNRKGSDGQWLVRPRATVSADIEIRRVTNVLAVPNAALLFTPSEKGGEGIPQIEGGEAIVWVLGPNKRPQPRKIRKGITNGNLTEVVKGEGLHEGDIVITAEPTARESGFSGLNL